MPFKFSSRHRVETAAFPCLLDLELWSQIFIDRDPAASLLEMRQRSSLRNQRDCYLDRKS